ncbi:GTPase IMAP family member 4-like isoform X2 [Myxocyprinus asiaticus]|uniref:GTPase IMAP family member 4-like isoform X2 n=1 Tax=Myxocyprinus asiaticus TaxID=70543 RepID=UPI0022239CAB|nr:GTPase IMAP family member 4-like isoform X2 [Myxocyprinus asiaticus]
MALRPRREGGIFTDEARQSEDSIKQIRFMMLGSNEVLMKEAIDTILGVTQRGDTRKTGTCEVREGNVCGWHVSVLKTPSFWLEHLQSYLPFSKRVKDMKTDMKFCYSLVFPGPHVFLLVLGDVRNSGKEHYILRALSEVFGKKALDYCMVLFIHEYKESDIARNRCVRKCTNGYYILKKTDQSSNYTNDELFQKAMKRTDGKIPFFTNHPDYFVKVENYFRTEYSEKMRELKEAHHKELEELNLKENHLREELNALQLTNEQNLFLERESQLKETQLNNDKLQREVDQLKARMEKVETDLRDVQETVPHAKIQSESKLAQKEEQLQAKEEQLHEREREMELEARERALTQRDAQSQHEHHSSMYLVLPGSSEHKDEREGETEEDLQASGSQQFDDSKPVRRDSMQLDKPVMSGNEHRPLHAL